MSDSPKAVPKSIFVKRIPDAPAVQPIDPDEAAFDEYMATMRAKNDAAVESRGSVSDAETFRKRWLAAEAETREAEGRAKKLEAYAGELAAKLGSDKVRIQISAAEAFCGGFFAWFGLMLGAVITLPFVLFAFIVWLAVVIPRLPHHP